MASPFAPVTAVDASTSVGAADATQINIDYRFFDYQFCASFAGTLASVGAADNVKIQVSPDAPPGGSNNGIWVTTDVFTSTQFSGLIYGPWRAIRVLKPGDQAAKVVFLVNGHRERNQQQ